MVMILAVKINLYASIGEGCAKKIQTGKGYLIFGPFIRKV
jgi:hypothetical protein